MRDAAVGGGSLYTVQSSGENRRRGTVSVAQHHRLAAAYLWMGGAPAFLAGSANNEVSSKFGINVKRQPGDGLAPRYQKITPAVKELYEAGQQSTRQLMASFQIGSRRTLYKILRFAGVAIPEKSST